ncbi:MAG: hypothetical protein DRJ05_19820, partial [Bacteroidetes bacterium]
NRFAILNENYVYADFKTRVNGSYKLLRSILEYAAAHPAEIKEMLEEADQKSIQRGNLPAVADSFAIKYDGYPTPEKITIKAFEADTIPGKRGYWRYKKSDRKVTVTVPYIADYYATESIKFPYAYILSIPIEGVIENLRTHGIQIEQLTEDLETEVERFKIEELSPYKRINQGHYTNQIKGEYINETKVFPVGTFVIRTAQPLGSLAAYLLEPQTDDGLLKWNFFDRYLVPQWGGSYYPYPVYRILEKTELETKRIN